jgi:hypothetical protein
VGKVAASGGGPVRLRERLRARRAKRFADFRVRAIPFSNWSNVVEAPLSLNSIVVASAQQVSCALGDEAAILNTQNSVYYGMNEVGASVWELLKAPRRVSDLRDEILREYEVDEERCERDVLALLEKLRSEGLIEVREGTAV